MTLKNGEVQTMTSNAVILATGARPLTVPAKWVDAGWKHRVWTYREAMVPEFVPQSIAIVGSGAIGIEFASFYRALGDGRESSSKHRIASCHPRTPTSRLPLSERWSGAEWHFVSTRSVNAVNSTDNEVRLDLGEHGGRHRC